MIKSFWEVISVAVILSLFLATTSNAEEVIFNKDWNPVLLKDDNTWEFIDVKGNEGNIVFSVVNVETKLKENIKENEFGELSYSYELYFYIKAAVENNTPYPIHVDKVRFFPINKDKYRDVEIYWKKTIKPGEKSGSIGKSKIRCYCDTPQRALSREEKTQLRNSINAEDLHGKIRLIMWHSLPGPSKSIKVPESSGISESALEEIVVIDNEYSVIPLIESILW